MPKLIGCKACGKEISAKAKTCPHCGEDTKATARRIGGLIALGLFALFLVWFVKG